MPSLSTDAERLLTAFASKPGVTADQVTNLRSSISTSPALATQVDAAIAAGHLEHFALLPAGSNSGGTYDGDSKTINLTSASLTTPAAPAPYDSAELTFVLGHEIQHGFNHAATTQAYAQFETDLASAAGSNHDYTNAISTLLATNRRDEAAANIEGWNALVGMVKAQNPSATLQDVYEASPRSGDFVDMRLGPPATYLAHPDLSINDDLSVSATDANIEAMGKHYFDKGATSALGHGGNSDYQNFYAAYAVGRASEYEALNPAPDGSTRMTINMQQLGLRESLLEQNGITLGEGTPPPQPYYDSSTTPPTLHHFDHTATTHTYVPIAAQAFAERQPMGQAEDIRVPNAADRALHEQIRNKVAALDAANGRSFDATSERLSASLLVVAKENGLDRVDHVVLSRQTSDAAAAQNIFVVKGALDDPASLRASIDTAEAAQRPVQESMQQLQGANQRIAENTVREQAQQLTQEHQRGALAH